MSFQLVPGLIIIFSIVGILILFLRRIPEVVEARGQLKLSVLEDDNTPKSGRPVISKITDALQALLVAIVKKIWHFMLEAKDLKQGQILASKVVRIVKPARVINIGTQRNLKKAEQLAFAGSLEEAEQVYLSIIRKNSAEYAAYEGLIKIYQKQRNYENILEILEYLLKHNPQNDSYLAQMGHTLMVLRRYKEAAVAYEKSLSINNLFPARFANLGLSYEAVGEFSRAKRAFRQALDLEPTNVQYLMMLVGVLLKLGENQQAITALENSLEMVPESPVILQKLESLRHEQREPVLEEI